MFLHLYWDIQKKVHIFKNRMFLRPKYKPASMFFLKTYPLVKFIYKVKPRYIR